MTTERWIIFVLLLIIAAISFGVIRKLKAFWADIKKANHQHHITEEQRLINFLTWFNHQHGSCLTTNMIRADVRTYLYEMKELEESIQK